MTSEGETELQPRIRVLDFEFDGTPADGGVIEIGYCDLISRSKDLAGTPIEWEIIGGRSRLCNPGRAISPESQAVHHIDDSDVENELNWKSLLPALLKTSERDGVIAYAAHGHEAEEQWMHPDWRGDDPLPVLCTHKASLRVFGEEAPKHGNQVLRYWRRPEGLDPEQAKPPHGAYPDAYVTAFLLRDLLNAEEVSIEQMIAWTAEPALLARCFLGDHRRNGEGTPWSAIEPDYLHWIVHRAGFHDRPDIRFTAQYWLEKHEMDQRERSEKEGLDKQLRANGLPTDEEAAADQCDTRQEALTL